MEKDEILKDIKKLESIKTETTTEIQSLRQQLAKFQVKILRIDGVLAYLNEKLNTIKKEETTPPPK